MPKMRNTASRGDIRPTCQSIRGQYEEHGARAFYEEFGGAYRNPHEPIISDLIARAVEAWNFEPTQTRILDLACGSGEATLALRALGGAQIEGIDPFTAKAYLERTGQQAEALSFTNIAAGVLRLQRYDLCVCSFAMHLAPLSLLPQICLQLSLCSARLLILTPHKRPYIASSWGWNLSGEMIRDRVRARWYESLNTD